MANKVRNTSGKFAPKSDTPRKIRSVNLTDEAWQWLASVAEQLGMSRNDYLEALAEGNIPFMEMVNLKTLPFMEMVQPECLPLMETVQIEVDSLREELEAVRAEAPGLQMQVDDSVEVNSLREELGAVGAENQKLQMDLGNYAEADALREELTEVRLQLATERADREEIESELSELKQNSAPTATLFDKSTPDVATILSKLRAKRKKSKTDLADLEVILEILES